MFSLQGLAKLPIILGQWLKWIEENIEHFSNLLLLKKYTQLSSKYIHV